LDSNQENYSNSRLGRYSHRVNSSALEDFREYCMVEKRLSTGTTGHYASTVSRLLANSKKDHKAITVRDVRQYLLLYKNDYSYANQIKALRLFFKSYLKSNIMDDFAFPRKEFNFNHYMPTKEDLRTFFDALESVDDKALFLFFASSGLRRNEVLNLQVSDVDIGKEVCYPNHQSRTKNSYFGFFNGEASEYLEKWINIKGSRSLRIFPMSSTRRYKPFEAARERTKLEITPKVLRFWFANEMARLGVPDRFIDAFQGRIPRSVLARHYTDYSVNNLKAIYDKANLKVLS
jgi:integrase